jgi:hypothetical protein
LARSFRRGLTQERTALGHEVGHHTTPSKRARDSVRHAAGASMAERKLALGSILRLSMCMDDLRRSMPNSCVGFECAATAEVVRPRLLLTAKGALAKVQREQDGA